MEKSSNLPKKVKKRSASYPAFSLQEIVTATKNLKDQLGDGPYSRDNMAIALGYKGITGSSSTKIASCVHFGLLDRNGNTYSQSELANRIFNYIDEDERASSLLEAFSKPALYQKLLTEYSGKALPLMLESILVRNYGIQESVVKSAVSIFKDSAEFVGALKNGVLILSQTTAATSAQDESPVSKPLTSDQDSSHIVPRETSFPTPLAPATFLSVNLPSGLVISYSQDLASAFAFGAFGTELKALNDSVTTYIRDNTIVEPIDQLQQGKED